MEYRHYIVCFLVKGNKVLLARKTRKIAKGLFNGYGGKIELGETPVEATVREVKEESGGIVIKKEDLRKVGVLFVSQDQKMGVPVTNKVQVYITRNWQGDPVDTDEMVDARWFQIDDLPFKEMLPADKYWIKQAIEQGNLAAVIEYDNKMEVIKNYHIVIDKNCK